MKTNRIMAAIVITVMVLSALPLSALSAEGETSAVFSTYADGKINIESKNVEGVAVQCTVLDSSDTVVASAFGLIEDNSFSVIVAKELANNDYTVKTNVLQQAGKPSYVITSGFQIRGIDAEYNHNNGLVTVNGLWTPGTLAQVTIKSSDDNIIGTGVAPIVNNGFTLSLNIGKYESVADGTYSVVANILQSAGSSSYVEKTTFDVSFAVKSVSLDSHTITAHPGDIVELTPTFYPTYSKDQKVTWSSSDTSIATVNNGLISALKTGKTTITVSTVDGNHKDVCEVNVVESTISIHTVSWDIDGMVTSNTYAEGKGVVIPSDPSKEGWRFDKWSPSVNTTMGKSDVVYKATWVKTFIVKVEQTDGGTITDVSGTYDINSIINVSAVAFDGYKFVSWSDGGLVSHTITVTSDLNLSAIFERDATTKAEILDDGSVVETTTVADDDHITTTKIITSPEGDLKKTVESISNENKMEINNIKIDNTKIGVFTESSASKTVVKIDDSAKADEIVAKEIIRQIAEIKEDIDVDSSTVVLDVKNESSATVFSTAFAFELAKEKLVLEVKSGNIVVDIDSNVLNTIASNTGDSSITIKEVKKDDLSDRQKNVVSNCIMVISIDTIAGDNQIHELNGTMKVSLPYTLTDGQDLNNLRVALFDDDGNINNLDCVYSDGIIIFETTHNSLFSIYFESTTAADMSFWTIAIIAVVIAIAAIIGAIIERKKKTN